MSKVITLKEVEALLIDPTSIDLEGNTTAVCSIAEEDLINFINEKDPPVNKVSSYLEEKGNKLPDNAPTTGNYIQFTLPNGVVVLVNQTPVS